MKARTLGIGGYLSIAVAVVGAWLAISRLVAVYGVNHEMIEHSHYDSKWTPTGYEPGPIPNFSGDYTPAFNANFLSVHTDGSGWFLAHAIVFWALLALALIVLIVAATRCLVMDSRQKYMDSCQSPECTCRCHPREGENAQSPANTAANAVIT